MTDAARRAQFESKRKMQEAAKKRASSERGFGPQFRKSPAGRRLAQLRKQKLGEE